MRSFLVGIRYFILLLLVCLLALPAAAQTQTPYDIALQRIEEARLDEATHLDLIGLGLTELPPEIGQLTQLQVLVLSNNKLIRLPTELGKLINLQELWLNNNQLSVLPIEFEQLRQLQYLTLSDNQLLKLLSEIGQLTQLEFLYISNNRLTHLPPEIGQLSNLHDLGLDNNELTMLPPEIGQLQHLCYLSIENNQVHHFPNELGYILMPSESCRFPQLYLYHNPLITPPPEVVAQGTPAILAYLREQAWYHTRQLLLSASGGVGILAGVLLLARWRYRRLRKPKAKRGGNDISG
jgi:hypothetical protein